VAEAVAAFLAEVPEARLVVMADRAPAMPPVPPERLEFVRWHPDTEARVLRGIDVGLMPLPDTDWGRGKCAFKMLQYMACGVPAVVSPVGMSAQILAMADVGMGAGDDAAWREALFTLYRDRDGATAMGQRARALAEERFSLSVISDQLAERMRRYV
jgi:glycosyltransferase involved in cell wall biosynthesis